MGRVEHLLDTLFDLRRPRDGVNSLVQCTGFKGRIIGRDHAHRDESTDSADTRTVPPISE